MNALPQKIKHALKCKVAYCCECQVNSKNKKQLGYDNQSAPYRLKALNCYNGSQNLFALTIATESGDIKRFVHQAKLVSWLGPAVRKYSSGEKNNRYGITKQRNKFLHHALGEAKKSYSFHKYFGVFYSLQLPKV